jgi:hypothetical protein
MARLGDVAIRHNRSFPLHDEENFPAGAFVDFDHLIPLPGWHADFGESDEGGAACPDTASPAWPAYGAAPPAGGTKMAFLWDEQ